MHHTTEAFSRQHLSTYVSLLMDEGTVSVELFSTSRGWNASKAESIVHKMDHEWISNIYSVKYEDNVIILNVIEKIERNG